MRRPMFELIALTFGAMLGIALHRRTTPTKVVAVALGSTLTGLLVSWLSGELTISWGFVFFDIGQVAAAAVGVMVLLQALEKRRATS
jgi:hypothetical protein